MGHDLRPAPPIDAGVDVAVAVAANPCPVYQAMTAVGSALSVILVVFLTHYLTRVRNLCG